VAGPCKFIAETAPKPKGSVRNDEGPLAVVRFQFDEGIIMAFIPPGSKWYLAEIVLEIQIEGEGENIVHVNLVLVRADSPEEAYQRALAKGDSSSIEYENPEGRHITVTFRGLRDLNVIHGDLEDGPELIYERSVGVPESELNGWISTKDELGVFQPPRPTWRVDDT
jgi:hypothetical protein